MPNSKAKSALRQRQGGGRGDGIISNPRYLPKQKGFLCYNGASFDIYCFEARKAYKFIRLDDHSPLYSGEGWGFAKKLVSSNPRLAVAESY